MKALRSVILCLTSALAISEANSASLTDIGAAAPTPGPNDIFQLSTNGNTAATTPAAGGKPDGLNFYSNNSIPPGQTFTTGTNSTNLDALAVRTSGLDSGGGYGTPSTITNYYLRIYSVSGTAATLIQSYTNRNPGFTDGDWLKWNNLSVPLAPNSTYGFSFSCLPGGGSSWVALAVSTNAYSGGQIALIPTNGGTMTLGSGKKYVAVFDLGMFANAPTANTPVASVNGNSETTVYAGQTVTLTETAAGTGTLLYQWQTDDGGGGNLTNIPGANSTNIPVTPANAGSFNYDVIVTNNFGSETSSVATLTVLPPIGVSVSTSAPMATMPPAGLGVCVAVYDNVLINSSVAPMLKAAGITAVRYPGGSYADIFNWANTTVDGGAYINTSDGFHNFMNSVVNPAGAQAIITANYGANPANNGGGDPNYAASWVGDANVTNHWGVKYWEIGNEVGGNGYYGTNQDWEYDLHYPETNAAARVGQPALSPAAYGSKAVQFINAMKANDPNISCGVGFSPGDNSYNTPLLQAIGTNVDFVIIHWYPGNLTAAATIPATVTSSLSELTNVLGAAHASKVNIAITETGAGGLTGAAVALYTADNYLTWIENGIVNVDYQILHTDILQNNQTPGHAYYGAMMSHLLANVGDTFLVTSSGLAELRAHAAMRQDGRMGVMLINEDPILTIPATVNISGPALATSGVQYRFGLTNFIGANDFPSFPVATNATSWVGNQFTVSVPPYTILDVLIPIAPSNTPPTLAPITNQTLNVGQVVAFNAAAADTDVPPQILTFSLLNGPTNATLTQLDNSDATFNWRPLVSQSNTTNIFSIMVTDNGTPPLSATQNFTLTVNPLTLPSLASVTSSNGQLSFLVNGDVGPDYAVEASTNLTDWSTYLITNPAVMPFGWTDTNAFSLPMRFYRIRVGPPLP